MSADIEQRKLSAIMFTDMVGYSALSQRDEKLAQELLEEHRRLLREIFPRFNGNEIKTIGDAFLIEFNSALEAAQCAIEIQRTLAKRNHDVSVERHIELKIGIHIGDVVHRGGDVYGDGVNIASRIEPLAGAGGICVSMDVERQIRNALEARFEKLAPTELKNISVAMDLFRIVLPWEKKSEVRGQKSAVRERAPGPTSRRFALISGLVLLLIIGIGWWWSTRLHKNPVAASPSEASGPPQNIPEKSIAVLPFENLSDDKSNAYFAEGIQDEILTRLAGVAALKVISRTSTAKYASRPEDLKTVSQQLGVATVLEGTVQRAADKVRVNVQLIDARADTHLWAKSYDRDIKDVFAVESEVSQEIADALRAKLSPGESKVIAAVPTGDPEAYNLFLKGEYQEREAESSYRTEAFNQAENWYRQAIARDPHFVLATAGLVKSRVICHHLLGALSITESEEVGKMATEAVRLAPDLAEAHIALGLFYYFVTFRYDQALDEFQSALALEPNNLEALGYIAGIHQRQGFWESSLAEFKKCEELDPRSPLTANRIGSTYLSMRMWKDAKRSGLHSLALDPHNVAGMHIVFLSAISGSGDVAEATRLLEAFPPETETTAWMPGGFVSIVGLRSYLAILGRDFTAALKPWDGENSDPALNRLRIGARTVIHLLAGETTDPAELEKARAQNELAVQNQPEDADSMIQLAWINLALKRNGEALRIGQQAIEKVPIEHDALAGAFVLVAIAEIQARAGEPGKAIRALQRLLSIPAGVDVSIQRLRIDPVWDPIRNDPGFQQLLAGKELVGPNK